MDNSEEQEHYAVLGLNTDASTSDILVIIENA